jgi:hypothetical protein
VPRLIGSYRRQKFIMRYLTIFLQCISISWPFNQIYLWHFLDKCRSFQSVGLMKLYSFNDNKTYLTGTVREFNTSALAIWIVNPRCRVYNLKPEPKSQFTKRWNKNMQKYRGLKSSSLRYLNPWRPWATAFLTLWSMSTSDKTKSLAFYITEHSVLMIACFPRSCIFFILKP